MLERTAVSLETCRLQRLVYGSNRSSKHFRLLRVGPWPRGYSATKTTPDSQVDSAAVDSWPGPLQSSLPAPAPFLEFLYPKSTHFLLRRYCLAAPQLRSCRSFRTATARPWLVPPVHHYGSQGFVQSKNTDIEAKDLIGPEHAKIHPELTHLLLNLEESDIEHVLDLYGMLAKSEQQPFYGPMIFYLLSKSKSSKSSQSINFFIGEIPSDAWNEQLQGTAINALISSEDSEGAIQRYRAGMKMGLWSGLEHVLADFISRQQWKAVLEAWTDYSASRAATGFAANLNEAQCQTLQKVPKLARLYLGLERYLEAEAYKIAGSHDTSETWQSDLETLRYALAKTALQQPCQPKQLIIILAIWNNARLYEHAILNLISRWAYGLESRSNMGIVSNLYETYRALSDARPSPLLLRGLFEIFYPSNLADIADLYRDWLKTWGDLDRWGFEKFLNLYAEAGNVLMVKNLWRRYVKIFPEALQHPSSFKSVLAVYAQTGNIEGVERQTSLMKEQYRLKPGIESWNLLLLAHIKAENPTGALKCFEELKSIMPPDVITYTHIMNLAAKRGDLPTILSLLDTVHKEGLSTTEEMVLALVKAYVRNDQLIAAEKICREFAERKLTNTAAWNELVREYGLRFKVDKCYELMQAMHKHNVEWDSQTYEALLQAMVMVRRIHGAYEFLRNVHKNKLLEVGIEHFDAIIIGAIHGKELGIVRSVENFITRTKLPMTFNTHVSLLESSFLHWPKAECTRNLARKLVSRLSELLPPGEADDLGDEAISEASHEGTINDFGLICGDPDKLRELTKAMSRGLSVLISLRDFSTAEELINVYFKIFPQHKGKTGFPPRIAASLMQGYFADRMLDGIFSLWKQTSSGFFEQNRDPQFRIYPAYRYDLCRPLVWVVSAFQEAQDGRGLLLCVDWLLSKGFQLNRRNWNQIITALTKLGLWHRAVNWCETQLISGWRGWNPKPLTSEEKHEVKNPRLLWPWPSTMMVLQQEWLERRKLAVWSPEIANHLRAMEEKNPILHQAFTTSDYEHLPATWVVPQGMTLNKSIKEMIKFLTLKEFHALNDALLMQRRALEQAAAPAPQSSPFHRVVSAPGETERTEPLNQDELKTFSETVLQKMTEVQHKARHELGSESIPASLGGTNCLAGNEDGDHVTPSRPPASLLPLSTLPSPSISPRLQHSSSTCPDPPSPATSPPLPSSPPPASSSLLPQSPSPPQPSSSPSSPPSSPPPSRSLSSRLCTRDCIQPPRLPPSPSLPHSSPLHTGNSNLVPHLPCTLPPLDSKDWNPVPLLPPPPPLPLTHLPRTEDSDFVPRLPPASCPTEYRNPVPLLPPPSPYITCLPRKEDSNPVSRLPPPDSLLDIDDEDSIPLLPPPPPPPSQESS